MNNLRNDKAIKALATRVRELRQARNLTMEKLAELSGIDYRQIANIELGTTNATISTIYAVSTGLGISYAELNDFEI